MSTQPTTSRSPSEPDLETCLAYAQASFMLVESLMLELLARGILSRPALVELIEAAAEGARPRGQPAASADSRELLRADLKAALIGRIANSIAAADTAAAVATDAAPTVSPPSQPAP